MSTLLILVVVVGVSIVAVTLAVVAEPDKPATERRWNPRDWRPRLLAAAPLASPSPPAAPSPSPGVATTDGGAEAPARARRLSGEPYRPPRWWQRLRSIVLIVILTTAVGATVAAIVGAVLALIGIGVREAVS